MAEPETHDNNDEQNIPPDICPHDQSELFKVTDFYGTFIVCVECGYIFQVSDRQAMRYKPLQSDKS